MDVATTSEFGFGGGTSLRELPFELIAAERLAAAAAAADGASPLSDQARLELRQGKRKGRLWGRVPAAAGGASAAPDHISGPECLTVLGEGEIVVIVAPESRGAGVGSAALTRVLGDWRASLAAGTADVGAAAVPVPGASSSLLAWTHGEQPAAEALLHRHGFSAVRELLLQRISAEEIASAGLAKRARALLWREQEGAAPTDPALPALLQQAAVPLTLREFREGSERDAAAWVRCNAAAFASHPEQGRIDLADFAELKREPWWCARDLTVLEAPESGEFAGYCWVKAVDEDCELYALGVRPEYAGRGLGKLLFAASLARMAERGASTASLYVDGDNPARHLYERAGFVTARRSVQWALRA